MNLSPRFLRWAGLISLMVFLYSIALGLKNQIYRDTDGLVWGMIKHPLLWLGLGLLIWAQKRARKPKKRV